MTNLQKMLLAAGLLLPLGTMAQTYIGYVNDNMEINKSTGVGFSTTEATYGEAIRIPASKAATFNGRQISGVRTMLSTRKVSNAKIFLTKELGGTPVAEASVTVPSNYRAGNYLDFKFSSPVELDGSEFYVGYTLTLNEPNGGKPCLYDQTYDFAEGTSWAYADGSWIDVSSKGYGAPVLKFIVDSAPSVADVVVKPFSTTNFYKASQSYGILGELYNFGNTPYYQHNSPQNDFIPRRNLNFSVAVFDLHQPCSWRSYESTQQQQLLQCVDPVSLSSKCCSCCC